MMSPNSCAHKPRHWHQPATCGPMFTHSQASLRLCKHAASQQPAASSLWPIPTKYSCGRYRCQGQKPVRSIAICSNATVGDAGLVTQQLQLTIRPATTPAELRAAAYLRASSFYTYPPGRSEWAARSHFRMKADAEWASVTAKLQGDEPAYKNVEVTAFIAAIPDDPQSPVAVQVAADIDASSKLPAETNKQGTAAGLPQLVIGTLDLNRGRNLPAEELQGRYPAAAEGAAGTVSDGDVGDPHTQRAYLSNVCVAKGARRYRVAFRLIQAVEAHASSHGISHLYVHVVSDNEPAIKLYQKALGFEVESQESEKFARAAGRPRRLLLCKRLLR